eukprot:CAMPEP_0179297670 /NCGR_PEP_ID=MMETSP0797-20121207/45587_1 /TAXON_ID=47934 /ORGANISM="Dinophysis acuminata, Strain DAEP01" /LENGTH=132 /DNA_ID=CAMNT_0021007013 /DNA_START=149 /DNA_END=544 /DNA_ORIENTATION=+
MSTWRRSLILTQPPSSSALAVRPILLAPCLRIHEIFFDMATRSSSSELRDLIISSARFLPMFTDLLGGSCPLPDLPASCCLEYDLPPPPLAALPLPAPPFPIWSLGASCGHVRRGIWEAAHRHATSPAAGLE